MSDSCVPPKDANDGFPQASFVAEGRIIGLNPTTVTFSAGVSIHKDAPHIRLADGVVIEEAARQFVDFVERYIGIDAADLAAARAEVERLLSDINRLQETERLRIATEIDHEASVTPCAEDATVARDIAALVRANFSYDEAERQKAALAQSSGGKVG